jgi:small subunit ribosomal protein S8
MTMTDPLADLLTRIRNACVAKHDRLDVPASNLKHEVCKVLARRRYLRSVERIDGTPVDTLRLYLNYTPQGEQVIQHMQRVSRPGLRVYRKASDIKPVLNGHGMAIISTSSGLLTDAEARERRVGGEVLCEVW